ncbi:hypothetical protein PIB30_025167 [Stylosanthes scabra]|uniref:Uncharacterized protein n=1 Tax=Stylosanthes scabra TaxID=79078 RepID=A0ABU6YAC3_9FABA|nr:hypothetical protein [Stylosanthes scabra]
MLCRGSSLQALSWMVSLVASGSYCVRMRLWREEAIIYTSGNDVRRLLSFTTERTDVGIQIQHLNQCVYSAKILTNDFMPVEPFPNDRYYAGRVLPGVVQNEIAW